MKSSIWWAVCTKKSLDETCPEIVKMWRIEAVCREKFANLNPANLQFHNVTTEYLQSQLLPVIITLKK